ncbi:short-chain dehydrogenase [Paraflavitalea sp. CAU 1676]|uniref:short-chain dehydrogenase n=1 Tax=Paraflavitalea sp. CAU 1676 TaxID=3032598 RepID=UPI0023DB145B|nr:short-chain dehydrogenase [Paraflavitalea sp. CAU 1676]MDF2190605.1 short-chain dehydrogenase [Paraflavitalea sp. CAU 1676]
MTIEQIESFLQKNDTDRHAVKVSFRTRNSFNGIFIKTADYNELKGKNFWRIINESNMEKYLKSKDTGLARIFNGSEFVKLSVGETIG